MFYVEPQQPQPIDTNNTNYITNYKIYGVTGGQVYSVPILYSAYGPNPAKIIKIEGTNAYYDNRDIVFAVFSYDDFITNINNAIATLFSQMHLGTQPPLFQYDHVLEKICYYTTDVTILVLQFTLV